MNFSNDMQITCQYNMFMMIGSKIYFFQCLFSQKVTFTKLRVSFKLLYCSFNKTWCISTNKWTNIKFWLKLACYLIFLPFSHHRFCECFSGKCLPLSRRDRLWIFRKMFQCFEYQHFFYKLVQDIIKNVQPYLGS